MECAWRYPWWVAEGVGAELFHDGEVGGEVALCRVAERGGHDEDDGRHGGVEMCECVNVCVIDIYYVY